MRALTLVALLGLAPLALAQSVYVYEDDNGVRHFSDRPPGDGRKVEVTELDNVDLEPEVLIVERRGADGITLVAVNEYHAPVELELRFVVQRNLAGESEIETVLEPASETRLVTLTPLDPNRPGRFAYDYQYMLGDPAAVHDDSYTYRVPYGLGRSFTVSQAYPLEVTHTGPHHQYAVDFAMPEGTPVHAARAGIVVAIAYKSFSGGTDAGNADKANLVQILHDDGTLAIYAHLALNSVRVRPGDPVATGQYIANSGNTGFSSGPHLHFAVERNIGMTLKTIPVRFAGARGKPQTPHTGLPLRAY